MFYTIFDDKNWPVHIVFQSIGIYNLIVNMFSNQSFYTQKKFACIILISKDYVLVFYFVSFSLLFATQKIDYWTSRLLD